MIELESEELASGLQLLDPVIDKKVSIPLLTSVLLDPVSPGKLNLRASNGILSGGLRISAVYSSFEPIAVDHNRLLKIVSKLPPGKTVKLKMSGNQLEVRCGKSKYQLHTSPVTDDFPTMARPTESDPCISVRPNTLLWILKACDHAIATEGRMQFQGIRLECSDGELRGYSTDTNRICRRAEAQDGTWRGFFSTRAIKSLRGLLDVTGTEETISLASQGDESVFFWTSRVGYSTRMPQNAFGNDMESVISNFDPNNAQSSCSADREQLIAAIERIQSVCDDGVISISFKEDVLRLTSGTNAGTGSEAVRVGSSGEARDPHKIRSGWLLQALKAIEGDYAALYFWEPHDPVVVAAMEEGIDHVEMISAQVSG